MMSNAKDRELSMIAWVVAVGFLLWLASVGLGIGSCVPEREEMDGPLPAVSSHAAAVWRSR